MTNEPSVQESMFKGEKSGKSGKMADVFLSVFSRPAAPETSGRMVSLDLFRALIMFILTVLGPMTHAWRRCWGCPDGFLNLFTHVRWEGCHLWDLLMPSFIFIAGAAVPLAMKKRLSGGGSMFAFWRHVLIRAALLWLLGMVLQGNLLTFEWRRIHFFTNTLQAIAAGYLITAAVCLIPRASARAALMAAMLIGYGAVSLAWGCSTLQDSVAIRIEHALLPSTDDPTYAWILPIPMFGFLALCGAQATLFLRGGGNPWRKALWLCGAGLLFVAAGHAVSRWIPIVKHIWSVSFTLIAAGWAAVAWSALYALADILRLPLGKGPLILFGRYALTAYLLEELFHPVVAAAANILGRGLPHLFGKQAAPFLHTAVCSLIIIAVLYARKRMAAKR